MEKKVRKNEGKEVEFQVPKEFEHIFSDKTLKYSGAAERETKMLHKITALSDLGKFNKLSNSPSRKKQSKSPKRTTAKRNTVCENKPRDRYGNDLEFILNLYVQLLYTTQ